MLEIKNLTKRYDETIIKNLNIILPSTGLIIIVGNSGCGKTTLLNLIGGIDQDYEGEILFDHQDIRKIKKYCRRHIGFIFQDFNLINWLNVKENYLLAKFFTKISYKRAVEDQEEKLELRKLNKKRVKILSGGQKQRVALLRAMIKNVDILLCDEPTGSLDDKNAKMVFELLHAEAKERLVIVITHNEQLAYQYADQCFSMQNGQLIGMYRRDKNNHFYSRLVKQHSPLKLYQLALLQYRANLGRNLKISSGITVALICIMITFTLSGSLQTQIKRQLDSIFPNQLISIQNVHKKLLSYHELFSLSNLDMNEFIYGEPADYEFMGVSLQSDYEVEKTIYISDMTKPIKSRNLEIGRETKNSNEIVLSKTTATHLNPDYQKLLNQQLYGYYLKDDQIKGVSLTVVGIGKDVTAFDTIYINELANLDHISQAFAIDKKQLLFQLAMINLNSKADLDDLLMDLEDQYSQFEFKVAGENINERIDTFMLQIQRVLLLFSLLAIVAACFLIGEVLYLSVIEKTKDIGIFKCMGASKLQIMNLVLLESFTLISGAFICSYVFFYQLVNLINQLVENELQLDLSGAFIQIDYQLVIVIYLGALCFGLCSSYIPAFLAGRLDPIKALKQPNY